MKNGESNLTPLVSLTNPRAETANSTTRRKTVSAVHHPGATLSWKDYQSESFAQLVQSHLLCVYRRLRCDCGGEACSANFIIMELYQYKRFSKIFAYVCQSFLL